MGCKRRLDSIDARTYDASFRRSTRDPCQQHNTPGVFFNAHTLLCGIAETL
jgi:hypothetical protein